MSLALALLGDVDEPGERGVLGLQYERAETVVGVGLYLEVIGAALCVMAGA